MFGIFKKSKPISNIEAKEMKKMMSLDNHTVLDVRTVGEFKTGHIEGATNLNIQSFSFGKEVRKFDPEKNYLVYCRSGKRSAIACKIMQKNGFENVYNLGGGIISWPFKVMK